jgi:hypothetical protein
MPLAPYPNRANAVATATVTAERSTRQCYAHVHVYVHVHVHIVVLLYCIILHPLVLSPPKVTRSGFPMWLGL